MEHTTKEDLNKKILFKKKPQLWKSLKMRGDVAILATSEGVSRTIISKAINKGEGSLKILNAIDAYYTERQEAIAE